MHINPKLSGVENILALINQTNDNRYRKTDLTFGRPVALDATSPDAHNTRITIKSTPTCMWRVNTEKTYRRIDIAVMLERLSIPLQLPFSGQIDDELAQIEVWEEMSKMAEFHQPDVEVSFNAEKTSVTLRALPESYLYVGSVTMELKQEDTSTQPTTQPVVTRPTQPVLDTSSNRVITVRPADDTANQIMVRYASTDGTGNIDKHVRAIHTVSLSQQGPIAVWNLTGDITNDSNMSAITIDRNSGEIVIPKTILDSSEHVVVIAYKEDVPSETIEHKVDVSNVVDTPRIASPATYEVGVEAITVRPGENNFGVTISFDDENEVQVDIATVKTLAGWSVASTTEHTANYYGIKVDAQTGEVSIPLSHVGSEVPVVIKTVTDNTGDLDKTITFNAPARQNTDDTTDGSGTSDTGSTTDDTGTQTGSNDSQDNGGQTDSSDTGNTDGSGSDDTSDNTGDGTGDNTDGSTDTSDGTDENKGEGEGTGNTDDQSQTPPDNSGEQDGGENKDKDTTDGGNDEETPPPAIPDTVSTRASLDESGSLVLTGHNTVSDTIVNITLTYQNIGPNSNVTGELENKEVNVTFNLANENDVFILSGNTDGLRPMISEAEPVAIFQPVIDATTLASNLSWSVELEDTARHPEAPGAVASYTLQANKNKPFVPTPPPTGLVNITQPDGNVTEIRYTKNPLVRGIDLNITPTGSSVPVKVEVRNTADGISIHPQLAEITHDYVGDGVTSIKLDNTNIQDGSTVVVDVVPVIGEKRTAYATGVIQAVIPEPDAVTIQQTSTTNGDDVLLFTKGENNISFSLQFTKRNGEQETIEWLKDGGDLPSPIMMVNGVPIRLPTGSDAMVAIDQDGGRIAVKNKYISSTNGEITIVANNGQKRATTTHTAKLVSVADAPSITAVYDGTVVNIGPIKDVEVLKVGIGEQVKTYIKTPTGYKHSNGENLVDTNTHFYTQNENGLTVKVLGSLAQTETGFVNVDVKATNEPLSQNNNFTTDLTLWNETASVNVQVNSFTQHVSETPTVTVDSDGVKVTASPDTTKVSVTYTDATSGTQITAVATKTGDTWASTVPTLNVSNTGVDDGVVGIIPTSNIKKPSDVVVSVVTGPVEYTAPATVNNTLVSDNAFGKPVQAGALEAGDRNGVVWLRFQEPIDTITVEHAEGSFVLRKEEMFMSDHTNAYEDGEIAFINGTFPVDAEITFTGRTDNAWDTPSTTTHRISYQAKPIPKAIVEVENGSLKVNRNGAHNLSVQYHSTALDKMNTLVFDTANAVTAQSNTDNETDNVSGITVQDGVITIPHGLIKDDTTATITTSNKEPRDGTNEITIQVGYYSYRTAPYKSIDNVDEYLRIYGETPDVVTMKVYYRKDTELKEVVFTRNNDSDPWKLITSVEDGLVRIEGDVVFMNTEKMDVGQTFSVNTYYAEPLDYPGTSSTIVPTVEYNPKTPSTPLTKLDLDEGLTTTIVRSEVGSGSIGYTLPNGQTKTLTFTVDRGQDSPIVLGGDKDEVTANVNDIFIPMHKLKEPSTVNITVKGKDERDNTASASVELEAAIVRPSPKLNVVEAGDYITITGFKPHMERITFMFPMAEINPYTTSNYGDVIIEQVDGKFRLGEFTFVSAVGVNEDELDTTALARNFIFDPDSLTLRVKRTIGIKDEMYRYSVTSNNPRYNNLVDVTNTYQPSLAGIPEVTVTADKDDEKLRIKFSDMAQVNEVYVVYEGVTAPEREHHMVTQSYFKDKPVVITTDLEYDGQPVATYTDKEFAINRNDIKLSGTGKKSGKVTIVITYYNYEVDQTTIEKTVYAINEDDAPEVILEPISVQIASNEKTITVTPDNTNEAIRALDVVAISKTNETLLFSINYNAESKTYTTTSTNVVLNDKTGVFTMDETKLLDGSTLIVKVHNGLSEERARFKQATYTVVNPVEPSITTVELEQKPKPAIVNLMNAGYFTVAPENDVNTNMLELAFWRPAVTEGGDVVEEVITVTRVKKPTDEVKWAIDSTEYAGVEFDAKFGLIKVTNDQVDNTHNYITATTTNIKVESVRAFKPGIEVPTLTSRDGVVTITPPVDDVTRDIIISYRSGPNKEVREVSMFKNETDTWELFSGYSNVTMDSKGVVTIAAHEAVPHTHVSVKTFVNSNGITYGPFTVVVTEPKPATKPLDFEVTNDSVKFLPKADDAELVKYIVSWSDANSEDEMYTVLKGDTWTGSGAVGASVNSTDGVMTITPISSEVKIGADIVVSGYNTQGFVNRQVFTVTRNDDAQVVLTELLVIAPAEMSSVNGDLTVRPVDDKANKMTINVLVKQ